MLYVIFSGFSCVSAQHGRVIFCGNTAHFLVGFPSLFQCSISYRLFANEYMVSVHFGESLGPLKMLSLA